MRSQPIILRLLCLVVVVVVVVVVVDVVVVWFGLVCFGRRRITVDGEAEALSRHPRPAEGA